MSGKSLKEKAHNLAINPKSRYALLQKLIIGGFFDSPVSSGQTVLAIQEKFGKRWATDYVQIYMQKFMSVGIIHAIKPRGEKRNYWVIVSVTREKALREIGKNTKVREIQEELFSRTLMDRLRKNFGQDLNELRDNFGRNGNSTAFLLRKILEKFYY